jgi:hypothetical protein
MKLLSRLMAIDEKQHDKQHDKKKNLPAAFQKKQHSKTVCKDCKNSYYYDVVKCPLCSSSRLVVEMIGGVIR